MAAQGPNPARSYLHGLIAARTRGGGVAATQESLTFEVLEAEPPHTDDVLQRVQETMAKIPASDIADPEEYARALAVFLRQAERTLRKVDRDPNAPLDNNDIFTMEAVIRTDGTRPTLLVHDDLVDPAHPLAGTWSDTLTAAKEKIRAAARAVGRIEPVNPAAGNFFGTGSLVKTLDDGKGLVLTNLHVLEAMWRRLPNAMLPNANGFAVLDGSAFIDFVAESGSLVKKRFQIVAARPSGIDGTGFARLDAAVLTIAPIPGESPALPDPITIRADPDGPLGNLSSFCVIGYPGKPPFQGGVHEGLDWTWVNATLFGGRFGVKRLAPGTAHRPLGTLTGDPRGWVFGHDATTLGGSSGSPVIAWLDAGTSAFGLHFAGASVDTNCAHAIAQCRAQLETLGVPIA